MDQTLAAKLLDEIEQCATRFERFMRSAASERQRGREDSEESLRNKANEQAQMIVARAKRLRSALLSSVSPTQEPPVLKTALSLPNEGSRLLAHFYDYDYFKRVMKALEASTLSPAPEPQK